VRKSAYARDNWYDVWLPALAPSAALLRKTRVLHDTSRWKVFERRYRSELKQPEQSHLLDMLAALSHQTDFSVGCYCRMNCALDPSPGAARVARSGDPICTFPRRPCMRSPTVSGAKATETFHKALDIDRPKLIQRDKARLRLKPAGNPPGAGPSSRGHRRDDRGAKVLIEFVR
jgi:uncharacterized protein YeaO (DUF488 family)